MNAETIYFVSDAHCGAPFKGASEWERRFIGFLHYLHDRAAALYILGDLFDFWIEYRHAIRPDYFLIVHELKKLIEKGIPVFYFAGNHDFALGPFFTGTLGIKVYQEHGDLLIQGNRIFIHHGDGLIRRDAPYRVLKALLRNRFNQAVYKLLPAYIGVPLGTFFSGTSRQCADGRLTQRILSEYRAKAKSILDKGSDVVLFGHTHTAELSRWGSKIYCNTGAWMRAYNFATMCQGQVKLWRYRPDEEPEEVPESDWK
ncbi:MAG: UDP-2,3-diacylglucosamine diphosphatase [Chitinispirillaceae bacterium]|nr:UDP-2,3-diacylglucosamine diphosphatase [Chitinispirillaceae bacterium]